MIECICMYIYTDRFVSMIPSPIIITYEHAKIYLAVLLATPEEDRSVEMDATLLKMLDIVYGGGDGGGGSRATKETEVRRPEKEISSLF
jgi:hypothetical protein